eukprot:GHVS01027998.1.p1 GENE.GHVS01027998.1~~GHVS01027998.1.p1  ORF type:complete len:252 (+),score=49.11 GHVS01027998.1:249-1004(+)
MVAAPPLLFVHILFVVVLFFPSCCLCLELCEMCTTGVVCYEGGGPPTSGTCTKDCSDCGLGHCQSCSGICIPVGSNSRCARGSSCCGNFSNQTECHDGRCCRRVGMRCPSSASCCPGSYCPAIISRCVVGTFEVTTTTTASLADNTPTTEEPTAEPLGSVEQQHECKSLLFETTQQNSQLIRMLGDLSMTLNKCMRGSNNGEATSTSDNNTVGRQTPTTDVVDLSGLLTWEEVAADEGITSVALTAATHHR